MSKYRAIPTMMDGIRFASKKEANRYQELKLLEKAGRISGLTLQKVYKLVIHGRPVGSYRSDFVYFDEDKKEQIIEDVKGFRTPLYRFKKRVVEAQYGIQIQEV